MKGQPSISPIYREVQSGDPDPEATYSRAWRWCRDLWRQCGTIAVRLEQLPEELRGPMRAWANDEYGERDDGKAQRGRARRPRRR